MLGTRLGEYEIEAELGSGGMGTVYRARGKDGSPVAVKVVHPHLLATPGFFKRFLREGEVGQRVRHENVVRTLDVDALDVNGRTVHFLVMEYVEGNTLRDLLRDLGFVPEALLREIAAQTAAGLAGIHAAGIVHRDLKPENVLITDDNQVRIMDLGIARVIEEPMVLTREGQFSGSLLYAAPEQFHGGDPGPASDMYSLGVLLYELATGENPFRRDQASGVMAAHLEYTPSRAAEVNSEVSLFLSVLIEEMLQKEPGDRIASAEKLRDIVKAGESSEWWASREDDLLRGEDHLPQIVVRKETALFGREENLRTLGDLWREAQAGEGRCVLLEGEAGIGKTRLIDAFLEDVNASTVHVLYGAYSPAGGPGGLSESLLSRFGDRGLEARLKPYFDVTPALLPAFAAMVRHESAPAGCEPLRGDVLHAVFSNLLKALAEERPVVWVVDDLQFAEPDSRRIVLSLARALTGTRALLVATARPELPEEEVAHFSRLGNFTKLQVGRLSPREVMGLLKDALKSERLAERLGGKIAWKSDGVPFFVFEMVRALKEGAFLKELPDGTFVETRVIENIEVPSAVRDLIGARLTTLSDEDREILDVGAVEGFEFDPAYAAAALDRKRIRVLQALARIERRSGVVRSVGSRYRFDQHQIRDVVYSEVSDGLRKEYHSLLAEACLDAAGREGEEIPGETRVFLARHLLAGSSPAECLPHLEASLSHLMQGLRNDAALRLAKEALGAEGLLEGAERAKIQLRAADCLELLGAKEEERAALEEAVTIAEASGDRALLALSLRRRGHHFEVHNLHEEAIRDLTAAQEMARDMGNRVLEARATLCLGLDSLNRGDHEAARSGFEHALAIGTEIDHLGIRAAATANLGLVEGGLGRFDEAERLQERYVELAKEMGDRRRVALGSVNLANVYRSRGRIEEAVDLHTAALSMARGAGIRRTEGNALINLSILHSSAGRLADAQEHLGRVLEIARETGNRQMEGVGLVNLGSLNITLGRNDLAREQLHESRRIFTELNARRPLGYALHALGQLDVQNGRLGEARETFEEGLALRREISYRSGIADTLYSLGELHARQGQADPAREHLEESIAVATECELREVLLLSRLLLIQVTGRGAEEAEAILRAHPDALEPMLDFAVRYRLWKVTGDEAHLEEAHRLLRALRDRAPEDCRDTMIEFVPEHREVMEARGC